ncbi:MAG: 5'-deoxyadenosine deaminase [Ignavibacteria bacterium]|nr:5'-deoxyadenosine deaminase [Ignavibacteria bacterium]
MATLVRDGIIITGNTSGEIHRCGSILIEQSRIAEIMPEPTNSSIDDVNEVIDATGFVVVPGFIQTHIHLCQTLFRGLADDLDLLDWLREKIFPFEAAHDEHSMYSSAMLGIAELIRSGTTTILDMGSINHEEEVIRAIGESGLRAFVGKAMMDTNDLFPKLKESTGESLRSTRDLAERWHNSYDGRVKYAVAPRFVLSCTERLLKDAGEMVQDFPGMLFHTHASENHSEVQQVRERCGMENIEYLDHIGVLSNKACLAHCIHMNDREVDILRSRATSIAHCPSSNLKLGSGIATIPYYREKGITVSLGADGAPCNNTLDVFQEMRLASLIQKPIHGPTALPAKVVFEMATRDGAKALGLEQEIGSIEVGKKADLVLLDLRHVWNPVDMAGNPYSAIVYSAKPENVDSVMIDGRWAYRKKAFTSIDEHRVLTEARRELKKLHDRL